MSVVQVQGERKAVDGLKLFYRWFTNEHVRPRAVICLIHGMGEHSGLYEHVAGMLVKAGFAVLAYDQRGHGRSGGKRGHTPNYERLMKDADLFMGEMSASYPDLPCFLYGHSMGGNVVLNYVIWRQPDLHGVIASSPWLHLTVKPPRLKVAMATLIHWIYPSYTDVRKQSAQQLTHDEAMIERFETDPWIHDKITARFFISVNAAGVWAMAHAEAIKIPLLLMHGDEDLVTSVQASREIAAKVPLCTYREWPGAYHELHNDVMREEVFASIRDWLDKMILAP